MMYVLTFIVQLVLFLTFLWICSTVFMGRMTSKKPRLVTAGPSRFAILVCAHNEEPVIGKLLRSWKNRIMRETGTGCSSWRTTARTGRQKWLGSIPM